MPCAPGLLQGKAAGGRIFEILHRKPDIDLDAEGELYMWPAVQGQTAPGIWNVLG